ncbi:hypothetical protein BOTBODRAFT_54045 [Botryobasidium botryosum FD-172 SS1]|uniref:Ras-domain-containing protein n=1 Tax=Botryobasidium botryosum (strain FD-172 SS1) TaxID=930990 RepID=A0A067MXC6_BOTB1|nr:hypothetical protein BOTBODRAFT_54045 [Botryobasidium botryosum FD-172 SS1]
MASLSWDYVLKFVIIGDASTGKSSILVRLTDQRFLQNPDPTVGVEFGSKLIHIPDQNKTIKVQCWDTAGTEAFRSITRSYYRGAAGALLVFDVTSRPSFTNARSWLADVREHADPNLTCVLLANKIDLCEKDESRRQVTREEAELWAKEAGLLFLEASAKTGKNVEEAFDQAARDILQKIQQGIFDDNRSHGVKSSNRTNQQNSMQLEGAEAKSRGCCT